MHCTQSLVLKKHQTTIHSPLAFQREFKSLSERPFYDLSNSQGMDEIPGERQQHVTLALRDAASRTEPCRNKHSACAIAIPMAEPTLRTPRLPRALPPVSTALLPFCSWERAGLSQAGLSQPGVLWGKTLPPAHFLETNKKEKKEKRKKIPEMWQHTDCFCFWAAAVLRHPAPGGQLPANQSDAPRHIRSASFPGFLAFARQRTHFC